MIRKLLLLLPLLVINIAGLVSCGTCIGVKAPHECITYTDIGIRALDIRDSSELQTGDSIAYSNFAIQLSVNDDARYCHSENSALLGNTAYACSKSAIPIIQDSIVSIEVISDHDFDDAHTAGSDLTAYFVIPDRVALNSPGNFDMNYLELYQAPAFTSTHTFTIMLQQKSGNVLTATLVPVKIGN
ncbi:MAG: DUF5034 domain-containing protein [Chitinophagaceae bacterium]|nr:DUF5034 domain-containing protein [Chitinophagaceae bacterium]MCB9046262.1 DUF5034 domain-containing protein [Chitinophagales bacterium]